MLDRRSFLLALLASKGAVARLLAQAGKESSKSPRPGLPSFVDVTATSGIKFKNNASHTSEKYLLETMVGGVAMFDYNGDGLLDLFFVNGAALADPMPTDKGVDKSDPRFWNRLYRNNGDGTFTDVTEQAGVKGHSYGVGAAVGDYDNNGYPDLYVTNFGENILYHNNGDGTFTDVTQKAGVTGGGWSASACFVDYDRDGFLDLVVSRYLEWDFSQNLYCGKKKPGSRAYCHPNVFPPIAHLVYHNNRDGTFTEVSKKCGFASSPGKGLGIAINDFDLDGWPDVFVNALAEEGYALFRNNHGLFEYMSRPSRVGGITISHSGWGTKFIDYDNDGWKDLFVAQGHVMDNIQLIKPHLRYLEPPLIMRNVNGKFRDVSQQSGTPFGIPRAMRGAAFGDLDNNGFVDIAINCNNGGAVILRNQGGNGNHWLLVNTCGTVSNRDGIGARIRLVSESGREQYGLVSTAGSYMSANDKRVHFGFGQDRMVKLLEITWPSGRVQRLEEIPADQILTVREPEQDSQQRED